MLQTVCRVSIKSDYLFVGIFSMGSPINLYREIDVMIYTIYSIVVSMELTIFLTKVGSMAGITYYMKMSLYLVKTSSVRS